MCKIQELIDTMVSFAKVAVALGTSLFAMNRILYAVEEYERLSTERATDKYMKTVCDSVDYKQIGRHVELCAGINHRLSNSVVFHVLKSVVDDTVHQDVTVAGIVSTFVGILIIMMISNLQHRYVKFNTPDTLPTKKMLKND